MVIPEFIYSINENGDRIVKDEQVIQFRCSSCGIGCRSVVFPWSPQVAKFECRHCGETIEIKTRDSAYDDVDGHIEEGEHQAKLATRRSFVIGSPEQDSRRLKTTAAVVTKQHGRALILDLE